MSSKTVIVLLAAVVAAFAYRIDVHHHVLPPFYRDELIAAGGDPSGFPTPTWTLDGALATAAAYNISKAYISVSSPGALIYEEKDDIRDLARRLNVYCAALVDSHPGQYELFASLPSLLDTHGALKEIKYAHKHLKAKGFSVFTSYGDDHVYLGNSSYDPIWEKLNELGSWVFVHPSPAPVSMKNRLLAQPVLDYPHETTRAASDLVVSDVLSRFPHIKFILSHGGGTLPTLAERIATGIAVMKLGATSSLIQSTSAAYVAQFKKFFFDVALVTSFPNIAAAVEFANSSHLLFGSDYPFSPSIMGAIKPREIWFAAHSKTELLQSIDHLNAEALGL